VPWTYWLTVILISVVGTGLTDALTDKLGVRLYTSTAFFALALLTTFWTWYLSDDSLSFETICTRRSESFYWTAILWTFALGTAAGDLATAVLGLGFARAVLVFGVLVGVTGIASRLGLSSVATFWIAYVLTMPLGAALGDLLTQSQHYGGFGWSARATSGIFLAVIIGLVALAPRRTAIPIDS
jgi:uncharacterized membrane-anchored protein